MKPYSLDGKHILITGASGGLGSALAIMANTMRLELEPNGICLHAE